MAKPRSNSTPAESDNNTAVAEAPSNGSAEASPSTTPANTFVLKAKTKADAAFGGEARDFEHSIPIPDSLSGLVDLLGEDVARALLIRQMKSQYKNLIRVPLTEGITEPGSETARIATDEEIKALLNSYKFSARTQRGRKPMTNVEKLSKRLDAEPMSRTELEALRAKIEAQIAAAG